MSGGQDAEDLTLDNAARIAARVGRWKPGPVLDHNTRAQIGTVQVTSRLQGVAAFWMRRSDGTVAVRVVPDRKSPTAGWNVFGTNQTLVARIAPTERPNWRGKMLPIAARPPQEWQGRIEIDGSIVALISDGTVVDLGSGDRIATLNQRIERGWWPLLTETWDLHLHGSPSEPWRVIALGWLGVAWFLDRAAAPDD